MAQSNKIVITLPSVFTSVVFPLLVCHSGHGSTEVTIAMTAYICPATAGKL